MQERAVILGEEIINDHAKKIMQKQVEDIERRIRETLNKITREKLLLMRLRKSLAQEFDWPVEELLRQLKTKMDADVSEI